MAPLLRELGHQVQVADARKVALVSKGHRKTDRGGAEVLARLGLGMPGLVCEMRHRCRQQQGDISRLGALTCSCACAQGACSSCAVSSRSSACG